MPVFKSSELLAQLKSDALRILQEAEKLQQADPDLVNRQPANDRWSVVQVLAHINYYSSTYNPRLENALSGTKAKQSEFKPGWLGNYFTKMMLPKQDGTVVNKMSAPKDSRPEISLDAKTVFAAFIGHQQDLIALLEKASFEDLDMRVATTISSLIKLKAGDTFRFLIAHQQRHFAQIERTVRAIAAPHATAVKEGT